MLNKQYKSKFETLLFTFNNSDKTKVLVDNTPASQPQYVDGLSVCQASDHTVIKLDEISAAQYQASKYFRIPTIILTKHDTLVTAFDVRWNSTQDIGKETYNDQCTAVCRSEDVGKSWSAPYIATSWFYTDSTGKSQSGASDPGLMYDDDNDCIFLFSTCGYGVGLNGGAEPDKNATLDSAKRCQISMSYSLDDGKSWSIPESLLKTITNPDKIVGTYATVFPGCSAAIKLKHQKTAANNGSYILPIQFWVCQYKDGTDTVRAGLLKITPAYDATNKTVTVTSTVLNGLIGGDTGVNGAGECSVCEDEDGNLVMIVKAYNHETFTDYEYNNKTITSFIKLYKSSDCGNTWTLIHDDQSATSCSKMRDSVHIKPSICYSDYTHKYYISYTLANNDTRRNTVIRYSDDLINWKIFDSISLLKCEYSSLITLNDPHKIGLVIEGSEGPNDYLSLSFINYIEYNIMCGTNTIHSNSTNEVITNTDTSEFEIITGEYVDRSIQNDNCDVKKIYFKPSVFTSSDTLSLSSFSIRTRDTAQNAITTTPVKFLIAKKDDESTILATTVNAQLMGNDYRNKSIHFNFETPVELNSSEMYVLIPYITNVEEGYEYGGVSLRLTSTATSNDYYIVMTNNNEHHQRHPIIGINVTVTTLKNIYEQWIQGFNFKINAVTDKKQLTISKLGFELGHSGVNTLFAMIYTKNSDDTYLLVTSNGHKAKSKLTTLIDNCTCNKAEFEFEYPITLFRDTMYYVTICKDNTEASPADYNSNKPANDVSMTFVDVKCDNDLEITVNRYNSTLTKSETISIGIFSGNKLLPRIFLTEATNYKKYMIFAK